MRSTQNGILCPGCRKLISADEPRCPHCGITRPGSLLKNNPLSRWLADPNQLIRSIIYVNAGMFLLSLLLRPESTRLSMNPLLFLSPGTHSLLLFGASGTLPIDQLGRWWSLLSANYLHGGILHIVFNMLAFRQIAAFTVREYGVHRMFVLFTLGGIAGFLVSYLAGVSLTIGSSAAVCSLIGAALYYGKSRGGIYGQAVYKQIGGWAVAIFLFGLLVPGINNWGHGGGMAAGALLAFLMGYREKKPETAFHRLAAWGCGIATVLVLLYAVVAAFSSLFSR